MYSQITHLQVPIGRLDDLRQFIYADYFPRLHELDGFIAAYLLEQIDDPTQAQIVQLWADHASIESARRTEPLDVTIERVAASIRGLRIQRQGYIIRVKTRETDSVPG